MLGYTVKDIQRAVYPPSFERGVAYQRSNRVNALRIAQDGRLITGTVQGDEREPYRVQVHIRYDDQRSTAIHGACSCSDKTNCKHVAALLLQALEHDENAAEDGAETEAAPDEIDFTPAWFERLKRHLAADGTPRKTGAGAEHLVYLLSLPVTAEGPRLAVHIHVVRKLKGGGYGKALPYSGTRTARYVGDTDRQVIQWLDAFGNSRETGTVLGGKHGAFLLRELVGTGRCHFGSKDTPPLHLGEERDARFEWKLLDDGSQQLRCTGEHVDVVLPLEPPWYVDQAAAQCGPLRTGVADRLAGDLAAAPKLSIAQAGSGAELLATVDPEQRIPRPRQFSTITEQSAPPVPCLRLFMQPIPVRREHRWEFDASEVFVELAHLSFDYAGVTTDLNDSRRMLTRIDGNSVVRYARDFAHEQDALRHIEKWHWAPLELQLAFNVPAAHLMDFTIQGTDRQDRLERFSIDGVSALRALGWRVEIAPDYPYRIVEDIGGWYAHLDDDESAGEFDVDIGVTIDGHRVSLLGNFMNLLRRRQRLGANGERGLNTHGSIVLHLDDGRLLSLPRERVDAVLKALAELHEMQPKRDSAGIRLAKSQAAQLGDMETALGADARWDGGGKLREIGERLRDFKGIEEAPPPPGFGATLRAYQQHGLNWLQFLSRYGLNGILADDMGLGKTVQSLAHLLIEKESGRATLPSLVIAPTSLMANWERETRRFAPALRTLVLHGDQRKKHFDRISDSDVVFTTYPLLLRDEEALLAHEYHLLLLDEAQNIKNVRTKASGVVRRIRAHHRLCLTGTPMENHLGELWSLFDFLMPGFLGDERRFQRLYRVPIEKDGNRERQLALNRRIAPFMLRRTKQEVVKELPPKTEMIRTIGLTGGQRELYESVRMLLHEKVREEITRNGFERSSVIILDALLKLRQICCDPRLLRAESLKAATQKANSAKLEMLMDMLPSLVEEGRRVLLFSQFTSMLDLIKTELNDEGIRFALLTGETRNRAAAIEAFQDGKVPVFLISLKAGGTGLNLTAADTVIHYDPWWNPAVENQATDRAYRIGQDKPVFVYKLVTAGTVEEAILDLQARKQALADGLFSETGDATSALTMDDLNTLFAPVPDN
jgi:superfamily II DNA or RNA helicase